MDSADLMKRAKTGDKEALIKLIMDNKNDYYKLAYVYLRNQEDSMDAMEDMIVIIYENIKKLKNPDAFYSWSKTILVNCCKNILRRKKKVILVDEYEENEYTEKYLTKEQKIDIQSALKNLNKHQEEAIKLKYFLDMDYEMISKITKTPIGTVKSRISIGLKRLREVFGGEY
jgi:RNA polymerase sigma-70 factor (ECF subfamily)